jgi:uncharacterized protein involved in exopolysaccharide biosynthesis
MVSTKELRGIFDDMKSEATKRAAHAISDQKIIRRSGPPGLLILGLGLVVGAAIGLIAAICVSPYSGEQARAKITERVEKMRTQHEMAETNGASVV